jgi:hypothetical protein
MPKNDNILLMFMKAIERLYQYLENKRIKPTNAEKAMGLSNGYLSVQKKRTADIGESVLNIITDYFHDIDPEWLLTGNGNMLRQPIAEQGGDRDDYKDKYFKEVEEHSALKSEHIAVLNELRALQKKLASDRERAAGVKVE